MSMRSQDAEHKKPAARLDFERDRFDDVPLGGVNGSRLGAHRAEPSPKNFGKWLLLVLTLSVLLTVIAVLWLRSVGAENVSFSKQIAGQNEQVAQAEDDKSAKVDPQMTVAVVNGTADTQAGQLIAEAIANDNLGNIVYVGDVSENIDISAVFYSDDANEQAAAGLAAAVGGVSHYKQDSYAEFGANLVLLVGGDYSGPKAVATAAPESE